jgi:hypothetical protein
METGVILGAPRSGTTFLMSFVDAMPETEAVTGNLLPIVVPHLWRQELTPVVRDALLGAFPKSLDDYLESGMFNSRSAAIRKWMAARGDLPAALRGHRRVERIVYKEPFLAFAPDYVYEALPEARIVYLLRDGRDVADSLVRSYEALTDRRLGTLQTTEAPIGRKIGDRYVPWWVADGEEAAFLDASPYVRSLWMWREMVQRCRAFAEREDVVRDGRFLQVRYEELVAEPRRLGGLIAAHLGGTMTRRMEARIAGAHGRSVGVHRHRPAGELEAGTGLAGHMLAACGYA